jgi:hypothetical protein
MKKTRKRETNILNRAINFALASVALAGVAVTTGQIGQEVYEEVTTDNTLINIDYGFRDIIIKSREQRTPEQLFSDIETAVLNVENIDKAFDNNVNLTKEEKIYIINDVIDSISEEANITTNSFEFEKMKYSNGYYISTRSKNFAVTHKKIYLKDSILEDENFKFALTITIHEMLHAVENENLMRSDQVTDIDKEAFFNKKRRIDYASSFQELRAQLTSQRIMHELNKSYGESSEINPVNSVALPAIIVDIMYNLYDINTYTISNYKEVPDEYVLKLLEDEKNYRFLTIDQIILKGLEQKLDNAGIEHEDVNLKDTYYYKTFTSEINAELLDETVAQFFLNNYIAENNTDDIDFNYYKKIKDNNLNNFNKTVIESTEMLGKEQF